ncbi:helix-turn-helix transcriptional regulator [Streptomyces sp. UNOC14_S4]|uniref:helix-turn-helix domain-containing protein n=1 Tax=Streptomyces sp. UNOC14_S4 TaxID=2872340 RepID=UPI001E3DBB58|nr:helix-turn-helix transcriptional regulator [Streptomyces sp. UNOC14_S4]MCC3770505.1 helix-turn-helix transcriptional regulator [Streptomyces sp. UNOC14_S4]
MAKTGNPENPISWRYAGDQMMKWRHLAGISREELAAESNYQVESIKSMEQGRRAPTYRAMEVADQLCRANGILLAGYQYVTPEPPPLRAPGYWTAESEAVALQEFHLILIPGLLQTEEYAQTLMRGYVPIQTDEEIEVYLARRMKRQERLKEQAVLFHFIVHEHALGTMIGGREVMRKQLQRLLDVGQQRNVFIQILPAGQGYFPGLDGPFTLLEGPDGERLVHTEVQDAAVLDATRKRVDSLTKSFTMLGMHALGEEESRERIRKVMEEL